MGNRAVVQTVALVFGIIYLAVGILGFLPFVGGSYTQDVHNLLGFVPINLLHNIVHLLIGIAGLAAFTSVANSRMFCQVVGVVLLLLGVVGIFAANLFGIIPIGGFDIAIHLLSGAVLAYFGFAAPISARSGA
jgi:Domain of unknown function (DUF4383)